MLKKKKKKALSKYNYNVKKPSDLKVELDTAVS